jgi:hypothetical protein
MLSGHYLYFESWLLVLAFGPWSFRSEQQQASQHWPCEPPWAHGLSSFHPMLAASEYLYDVSAEKKSSAIPYMRV